MKDVREKVLEAKSKGSRLTVVGALSIKVCNALLKPTEEFGEVVIRTNLRLPSTVESRASSIKGKPKSISPVLFGLRMVNPIVSEGFESLIGK